MKNHADLKTDLITHHSSLITSGKRGFISELARKQSSSSRRREGFTLIELLLYMGLVAIFMTATIYFAWDVVLGSVKAGVHQEVQENLRFASHRIQVEVRNADNIISIGESELSLSGTAPDYPVEFQVNQEKALQLKRGGGDWIALTSSLVEVKELVFTDLSEFQVLACKADHACCFVLQDGGWICEKLDHHGGLDLATDCRGELGGGSLGHHDSCKGDLTYENIHFTLTIRHQNPSGRSEWEKEATLETSVQLR